MFERPIVADSYTIQDRPDCNRMGSVGRTAALGLPIGRPSSASSSACLLGARVWLSDTPRCPGIWRASSAREISGIFPSRWLGRVLDLRSAGKDPGYLTCQGPIKFRDIGGGTSERVGGGWCGGARTNPAATGSAAPTPSGRGSLPLQDDLNQVGAFVLEACLHGFDKVVDGCNAFGVDAHAFGEANPINRWIL